MPNYELKAQIMNNNPEFINIVKQEQRFIYLEQYELGSNVHFNDDYIALQDAYHSARVLQNSNLEVYRECERIVNADSSRRKRLRKRIENMFTQGTCVFLTLTFTDEVLQNTDEKTRRVYVARFLKSVSTQYVGNVDFGKENGREHYHAVIVSNTDDFSSWTYGFYKAITVRKEQADAKRLATYVSKLTNHAIKETTKRNALIYSR